MIYKINKNENEIKVLGEYFVKNNKGKCKLKIKEKKYEISEHINIKY